MMTKRFTSVILGLAIVLASISIPVSTSAESNIFVDEYTKGSVRMPNAFYHSNVYEVNEPSWTMLGDATRASRLTAGVEGIIVYECTDVSVICMQGCSDGVDGLDFKFEYSVDNEKWIELAPFYYESVKSTASTDSNYTGGNYYFVDFPSGKIYFKIIIPASPNHHNYGRCVNFTKIESGGLTLLASLDESITEVVRASFEDDSQLMKKTEGLDSDEAIRLLYHLNAIDSTYTDEEKLNSKIKKGEFASVLAHLTGNLLSWPGHTTHTKFSDVSSSTQFAAEIAMVTELGYMTGNVDGSFRPDSFLTGRDAATAALKVLGYDEMLKTKGILETARRAGLKVSAKLDGNITCKETIALLFSMLNAYPKEQRGNGYGISDVIYMTDTLNLVRMEGQITVTAKGSILSDSSCETDEIMIDAEKYSVKSEYLNNNLGQRIYFYLDIDSDDNSIVSYGLDKTSKEPIKLRFSEIVPNASSNNTIAYEKDESNSVQKKSINIRYFVLNGSRVHPFDISTAIDSDVISFYDGDSNGVYETAIAEKYEEIWVNGSYPEENVVIGNYGNTRNEFNPDIYETINYNRNGKVSGFTYITENDILQVTKSSDNKYLNILINSEKVEGSVDEITSDGAVCINGKEYELSRTFASHIASGNLAPLTLDSTGIFYLNSFGEIAAYKSNVSDKRFGFIVDAAVFHRALSIMMFDESGEMLELESKNKVVINYQGTKNKLDVQAAYDKIASYSHMKNASTNQIEGLVQYKTDAEGKIHTIYLPSNLPDENNFSIDYEKAGAYSNGSNIIDMQYRIDDKTKVFAIPYDRTEYENYAVTQKFTAGYEAKNAHYNVTLYDVNDDRLASAIVLKPNRITGDSIEVPWNTLSFISDKRMAYNPKDDEFQPQLGLMVNGVKKFYFVKVDSHFRVRFGDWEGSGDTGLTYDDLAIGDAVQFATYNDGTIGKVVVHYKRDTKTFYNATDGTAQQFGYNRKDDFHIMNGYVVSYKAPFLIIDCGGTTRLLQGDSAKISVYYPDVKDVLAGDTSSFTPGDMVVFRSSNTKINNLIIIKQ